MPNGQHLNKIVLVIGTNDQFHRDLSQGMRIEMPDVSLLFEKTTLIALMDSVVVSFGAIVFGVNADAKPEEITENCDLLGKRFPKTGLILFPTGDVPKPSVGNWIIVPDRDIARLLAEIKRVLETL